MTDGCFQIGGSDSTLTSAFYLHLALRAENIADYRDRVKAKHYADIALILDGERFEMNYEEFKRRIKEMSELKPCPFCGYPARQVSRGICCGSPEFAASYTFTTVECGFDRNGSHSAGHYVCNCGWEDAAPLGERKDMRIGDPVGSVSTDSTGTPPVADAGGLVRRLEEARKFFHRNLRECCGERDTAGTCMAPACSFGDALKAIDDAINALTARPDAAGWIPVETRLPEPDTEVLVYYNGCSVYTADVDRKGKGVFIGDKWHEWSVITHWMPLPAAPEQP